jgi:hypothetical protein
MRLMATIVSLRGKAILIDAELIYPTTQPLFALKPGN